MLCAGRWEFKKNCLEPVAGLIQRNKLEEGAP